MLCSAADGAFLWIDRDGFRAPWIEGETFGGHRMPVIRRAEMQKFADHVMGYIRNEKLADGIFAALHPVGSAVQAVEGPFAAFPGVVEAHDGDSDIYRVTISIFGRGTPVDLAERQMKAA